MTYAEKFVTAWQSGDKKTASLIAGNFTQGVDVEVGEDFDVWIFEDKSMAGFDRPEKDNRQAWVLGSGEK